MNRLSRKSAARTRDGFFDININILSGKYRRSRAKKALPFRLWPVLFMAVAIALLLPLHLSLERIRNENYALAEELRLANLNLDTARLDYEDSLAEEAAIETTVNTTLKLKAASGIALGGRGAISMDLQTVTGAAPPEILLTSLTIENGRITLRGETDSVFTAIAYAVALEEVPFREVRLSRLDETEPENESQTESTINFEIVILK